MRKPGDLRGRRTPVWSTWSKTVRCGPAHLIAPSAEAEIVRVVRRAAHQGLTVRAAGTGHSFNPLATTAGVLLDLRSHTGVTGIDHDARTVTVRAGTPLWQVSKALDRAGLALPNIGTLAEQTVAGAVSTGNHGTGIAHPPLSGDVTALRLVTADGRVRELDRWNDSEVFRCARTALGALGVVSTVTLRCVPAFNLRVVGGTTGLEALLERFEEWATGADHVALSWLPWSDAVTTRTLHVTDRPPTPRAARRRYGTTLEEVRCGLIGQVGRFSPRAVPLLTGAPSGDGTLSTSYVDTSHRVFTFPQPVRFLALEHALPLENVPEALRALRGALRRAGTYSPYSVLTRVGAADDAPLSPAYGRRTGYVNLTVPRTAAYLELLRIVEHVLREFDARPHWGKAHTATAEVLAPRYPEWDTFQRVRAQLDPQGMFTNDYLTRVLGPVRTADPRADRVEVAG